MMATQKTMELSGVRTRVNHVSKAKSLIVAGLNVVAPGDAGYLWEVVRKSGTVEKELGIGEQQEDKIYLEVLTSTESHRNTSSWETRRLMLQSWGIRLRLNASRATYQALPNTDLKWQDSILFTMGVEPKYLV